MSEMQAAAECVPPDCGLCHRTLLVGEALRLFRDTENSRLMKVCELCQERARNSGYEALGVDSRKLRVQASGSVRDVVGRDALIEGLGNELAFLQQQLGEAQAALLEQSVKGETLRAITDKLRRQERELERMRKEVDPVRRAHEEKVYQRQSLQLAQVKQQLLAREQQVNRLQAARKAETDPAVMSRHALDAFNSSEHADRMMRIARTLGDPDVSVRDQGSTLPRKIHLTLSWDIAWYEFCVKLDLGTGKASISELGNGGDPRVLNDEQRVSNAQWRTSGLVMRA